MARTQPNIIFLMDDQHRWDALGFINPVVRTPNLGRLAANGVFYDQAVCQAPMCVPSRNSMMFGLYPNQVGVLRNEEHDVTDDRLPNQTLPQMLQEAGYYTAGFGKTHWGIVTSTRGFRTRYVGECLERGAVMMKDENPLAKERYDREVEPYGAGEENNLGYLGCTSQLPEEEHRDGWVTNRCLDFIDNWKANNQPLFLYLSFLKPHAGHNVPVGYTEGYDVEQIEFAEQPPWLEDKSSHAHGVNRCAMYKNFWSSATERQWKEMTMRYWANCTWIDSMFGRVLAALEDKGLLDNSIIVYLSDHGEMLGERHHRFNKYCLYESSVRVPIIVSGMALPDSLRGSVDSRPAELVDVYPTLMKIAGLQPPGELPGLDLLGDDVRHASFSAVHEQPGKAAFMLRSPDFKLILVFKRRAQTSDYRDSDITAGELYHLANDPQEWHNLYDNNDYRHVQRNMTQELLMKMLSLYAGTQTRNSHGL